MFVHSHKRNSLEANNVLLFDVIIPVFISAQVSRGATTLNQINLGRPLINC